MRPTARRVGTITSSQATITPYALITADSLDDSSVASSRTAARARPLHSSRTSPSGTTGSSTRSRRARSTTRRAPTCAAGCPNSPNCGARWCTSRGDFPPRTAPASRTRTRSSTFPTASTASAAPAEGSRERQAAMTTAGQGPLPLPRAEPPSRTAAMRPGSPSRAAAPGAGNTPKSSPPTAAGPACPTAVPGSPAPSPRVLPGRTAYRSAGLTSTVPRLRSCVGRHG